MRLSKFILGALLVAVSCTKVPGHIVNELRAPAYPLITIDPYTSVWSSTDKLYDSEPIHWTETDFPLLGILTVDGVQYRFMGLSDVSRTAVQHLADVQATRTIYDFTCGPVDLKLTFMAPLLMDDLDLLSRPVNYISYEITSNDGSEHDVEVCFRADEAWAWNDTTQVCVKSDYYDDRFCYVKCGTESQQILGKKGDDLRIDWGYFYMAADKASASACGDLLALSVEIGKVGDNSVDGYVMVGYDDLYSIQYFGRDMRPYWNRNGDASIEGQFTLAADDYAGLKERCVRFDNDLMHDAVQAGGKHYAELCALAYRQTLAAHKLIMTPEGDLAYLSKECDSNGSIGTVDLSYPSSPLFLLYNPELAKALINFIFHYSESGKWTSPYPAHDVGTYPVANGQTFVGDMPVEEAGNMLILTDAICKAEGAPDYALLHWEVLTQWADYLVENGLDPADQLCTDDFAGRFPRNTNLSAKAVLAIAAYADLAEMADKTEVAEKYSAKASEMAAWWKKMAVAGDHYALTFDRGDTWSQKYNLVWDRVLGYGVFDGDIVEDEIAFYLTRMNEYGLPLDSRRNYAKSDWTIWTATMAPDMEDFHALIEPVYRFFNETVDRVPMTDWYNTDSRTYMHFKARSVVGGYFMKVFDAKYNGS